MLGECSQFYLTKCSQLLFEVRRVVLFEHKGFWTEGEMSSTQHSEWMYPGLSQKYTLGIHPYSSIKTKQ